MRIGHTISSNLASIAFATALGAIAPCLALDDPYVDLRPETAPKLHQERIPHADQTTTNLFVFPTVPGVAYTIQTSLDLTTWTYQGEIYGAGQEIAVPMIRTQPPPDAPPSPPTENPSRPVSLMMQRTTDGGIVIYWHSLSALVVDQRYRFFQSHHFPDLVPDPAWDNQIAYVKCFGDYSFSIANPRAYSIAPANASHSAADQAMLDVFEASFTTMNQEVHDHTAAVVEIQPPPPPDPNSKKFFRVRADWGIDSDGDSNPDWLELDGAAAFAAANPGVAPEGLRYDAFNADTDANGEPDGMQTDRDGDGYPDFLDADVRAAVAISETAGPNGQDGIKVAWTRPPGFCFAVFQLPVDPDQRCQDLSPNGTVLFKNLTSCAVTDTNLDPHMFHWGRPLLTEGDDTVASMANALLDDRLLAVRLIEDPDSGWIEQGGYWDPLDGTFEEYWFPGYDDSILDSRGAFQVRAFMPNLDPTLFETPQGVLEGTDWNATDAHIEETGNIASGLLYWRYQVSVDGYGPPQTLDNPICGCTARLVNGDDFWTLAASGPYLLVSKNESVLTPSKVSLPSGEDVLGATRHGWVATTGHVWDFDLWTRLRKRVGGLSVSHAEMLRVSDSGMGVARLRLAAGEEEPFQPAICLLAPVSVEPKDVWPTPPLADSHALGVDDISMLSFLGNGRVSELWIMVPAAGGAARNVTLRGPFSAESKLTLAAENKLAFAPATLEAPATSVTITSPLSATEDVPIRLTRGGKDAANHPLMAKVMKKRVVKVALHRVKGIDATGQAAYPRLCPDAATLAAKLNAIYEPQINTTFEVTPFDEAGGDGAGIDFDTNNDGDLLVNNDVERWNATPHSKLSLGLAHIDIWLVGGAKLMSLDQASVKVKVMGATTSEKSILIDGDFPDMSWAVPPEREIDVLCNTMAHEIGHVMGLDGHPSEPGYEFSLRFENGRDPFLTKRLMCPGDKANLRNLGTCLIKREWDKFEEWLYANVDT